MGHGGPGSRGGGQIMRKLSIARDFGYSTFTAGIRSGWKAELCSRKFRQVRACLLVRVAERCAAPDCRAPEPAEPAPSQTPPRASAAVTAFLGASFAAPHASLT